MTPQTMSRALSFPYETSVDRATKPLAPLARIFHTFRRGGDERATNLCAQAAGIDFQGHGGVLAQVLSLIVLQGTGISSRDVGADSFTQKSGRP